MSNTLNVNGSGHTVTKKVLALELMPTLEHVVGPDAHAEESDERCRRQNGSDLRRPARYKVLATGKLGSVLWRKPAHRSEVGTASGKKENSGEDQV